MAQKFVSVVVLVALSRVATANAQVPAPDPSAAHVPQGYRVEVVLKDLTYPTSVEFDTEGTMYVVEAGYSYGDPSAVTRILRVDRKGAMSTYVQEGLNGPVADLLHHDGRLYVAHRGKISVVENGKLRDLVTGLPSDGDHHTNQMAVGPDGKIYFGQGTATNSGVVGVDNFKMGWLKQHPNFHDVPAKAVRLRDKTFTSENPLSEKDAKAQTAPFQPFGQGVPADRTVQGTTKASGTILRMNPDGSGLEVYAWGLRNPFGVVWRNGKLYASENGFDARGSRPVANDKEDLYEIKEGAWYGWPDYASGIPVTDARFKPKDGPAPEFVMAEHPAVEKPLLTFPEHSAATKLAVSPGAFGDKGDLFLAFFGHMAPMTGTVDGEHGGHRVVRINPDTQKVETFFSKKEGHAHGNGMGTSGSDSQKGQSGSHGQQEESLTPGPRRLVDVVFSPDGRAMYVVDFGAMVVEKEPKPFPGSGVVWRIMRDATKVEGPPANLSVKQVKGGAQ
jgi:glucose/arabinose dehydrogenase